MGFKPGNWLRANSARNSLGHYTSISSSSDSDLLPDCPSCSSQNGSSKRRRRRIFSFIVAGFIGFTAISSASFYLGRLSMASSTVQSSRLKTDRAFPEIPMRPVVWKEDKRFLEMDPTNAKFWSHEDQRPNWTIWDEIHRGSWIQLSPSPEDDIVGGLPLDQFAENGHWPNQKQGFVPSVLHQLHCVGVFTHDLIKLKGGDALTEREYEHFGHCIEYIRHAIMCYGDTTLEKPRDNSGPRATGYGTVHMCRDWAVLSDFLWGASINFKSGPTGLPVVFENVEAAQGNPNGRLWDFE